MACFLARNSTSGGLYDILAKDTSNAVKYQCNACVAPFVLWAQPAVLSVALATYASLAYYLGAGHSVPRKFSTVLGMILIAVWVAAGLGSLGGNLSAAIFSCVIGGLGCPTFHPASPPPSLSPPPPPPPLLAGFVALAACDMYAHGFDTFKQHFTDAGHDWENRLAGYEDVLRGLAVYTISPLLVVRACAGVRFCDGGSGKALSTEREHASACTKPLSLTQCTQPQVYLMIESMHQGVRVAIAYLCPCDVLTDEIRQSTSQAPPDLSESQAEEQGHERGSSTSSVDSDT